MEKMVFAAMHFLISNKMAGAFTFDGLNGKRAFKDLRLAKYLRSKSASSLSLRMRSALSLFFLLSLFFRPSFLFLFSCSETGLPSCSYRIHWSTSGPLAHIGQKPQDPKEEKTLPIWGRRFRRTSLLTILLIIIFLSFLLIPEKQFCVKICEQSWTPKDFLLFEDCYAQYNMMNHKLQSLSYL